MALRQLKARAIGDKNKPWENDVLLSEGIQILIDEAQNDMKFTYLKDMDSWVIEQVTETLARLDTNRASLDERRQANESDVRADIEQVRRAAEARHIQDLTRCEVDRQAELLAANSRRTSDYWNKMKHAQVLTSHDEIDAALGMKADAEAELADMRDRWADEINIRYDKKIEMTTGKQLAELEELQRTFDSYLDIVQAGYENDVAVERRKAGVWIQRTLQKAIANPDLTSHQPALRKQLAAKLTASVEAFLIEQGQESLLHLQ
jgi:hypothetical protein